MDKVDEFGVLDWVVDDDVVDLDDVGVEARTVMTVARISKSRAAVRNEVKEREEQNIQY